MSTIQSSAEHLTLNADGSSKDIKFQANGVEKASISSAGAFTSTTIDATALTGDLPAISGANLTGIASSPFTEVNANNFTYTTATNPALDVIDSTNTVKARFQAGNTSAVFGSASDHTVAFIAGASETTQLTLTTDGRGLSQFTAKAWINFNGQNTISIRDSHNVSSITDNGTGSYNVTMSNAMANVNYCVTAVSGRGGGEDMHALVPYSNFNFTTTQFRILTLQGWDVYHDASYVGATVFGD